MAITISSAPKAISLARNPIIYEISTDNLFSLSGTQAVHRLTFTGLPSVDDEFDMTWLDGDLSFTFIFKASPNDSGLQLPTGSGTISSYLQNTLIPALKLNYYLDRDYFIDQSGDSVFFTAREKGAKYDILFQSGIFPWTFTKTVPGVDPIERANFRFIIELFTRPAGGDWTRILRERVPIQSAADIDLSEYLRSFDYLLLPSDLSTLTHTDISAQLQEYYVRIGESFGTPLRTQKMKEEPVKLSLYGGLSEADRDEINFYDDLLPDFLTWRKTQYLSTAQPAFLSFINKSGAFSNFWLVISLFDAAGSLLNERNALTFTTAQHKMSLLPVGYNMALNGVSLDPGDEVAYYTVKVQRASTTSVIADPITFNVMRDGSMDELVVAWQNSLGAYETATLWGAIDNATQLQSTLAFLAQAYNTDYDQRGERSYNHRLTESFTLRSGFMDKQEIRWFVDFLASEKKYIIAQGRHWPIVTPSDQSLSTYASKEYVYAFELNVNLQIDENFSDARDQITG